MPKPKHKRKVTKKPGKSMSRSHVMPIKWTVKEWKDFLWMVSDIVREIRVISSGGQYLIAAMDPANVAMFVIEISVSRKVPKFDATINTKEFYAIMKEFIGAQHSLDVKILYQASKEPHLKILVGKSDFTLPVTIPAKEDRQIKVPNLTYSAAMMVDSKLLEAAIKRTDMVDVSVRFSIELESNELVLFAKGDDKELPMRNVLDVSAEFFPEAMVEAPISSKFSVEYLKKILKHFHKFSPKIKVYLRQDYPVMLEIRNVDRGLFVQFILAPRVDND